LRSTITPTAAQISVNGPIGSFASWIPDKSPVSLASQLDVAVFLRNKELMLVLVADSSLIGGRVFGKRGLVGEVDI
jgi:hypothetical protein